MVFYIFVALLTLAGNSFGQDVKTYGHREALVKADEISYGFIGEHAARGNAGPGIIVASEAIASRTLPAAPAEPERSRPRGTSCAAGKIAPVIASRDEWDARFVMPYGDTVPGLNGNHDDFAWTLYYWIRSYVSMAVTYGDALYLDRAVESIEHMLEGENEGGGWGAAPLYNQLDTAQVTQAIMSFVYTVHHDPRFRRYRSKADRYMKRAEHAVQMFDHRWVERSSVLGASFYVYSSCGPDGQSLCGDGALLMYNQGASMAKALLLMDRVYRLKGLVPPPAYLYKADKTANYFLAFAQPVDGAYLWRYEGGRPGHGYEDINHGHVDMSFLIAARKFNVGNLRDSDMLRLAATLKNNILNDRLGLVDVAPEIDGAGLSRPMSNKSRNYERVGIGYDWIDLADYDPGILDKVVKVFNKHMIDFNSARAALGWAEILRKSHCISLY